jgi:hypothetical protein
MEYREPKSHGRGSGNNSVRYKGFIQTSVFLSFLPLFIAKIAANTGKMHRFYHKNGALF